MADDAHRESERRPTSTSGGGDLQTLLARAYMSGNGAEVERVLRLITEAQVVLPPKTRAAA
jgi:hypothetical protein